MVGFVVGNLFEGVVDRLASVPMGFLNLDFGFAELLTGIVGFCYWTD